MSTSSQAVHGDPSETYRPKSRIRGRQPIENPWRLNMWQAVAIVTTFAAVFKSAPADWPNLSRATQLRFRYGGLGRGLVSRPPAMARRLYEKEVPQAIRNLGESAVRDFLIGKHLSHVKSAANVPGKAKAPGNVILEDAAANLSRGNRNMTATERAAALSAGRASAIRTGAKALAKSGAKAGLVAAAMEAAVAVPENVLHYRRGRKTGGQAVGDAARSTATAAGVGVATAVAVKGAAIAGIGLSLGPFGPPLMVAGGVVFVGNGIYRVGKAAKRNTYPEGRLRPRRRQGRRRESGSKARPATRLPVLLASVPRARRRSRSRTRPTTRRTWRF